MKKYLIVLIIILIPAAGFRLWRLNEIPVSMSDDEIKLSYSAYSTWETGKDVTGKKFPLAFVLGGYAFNPVPIYSTSPVVGILGLNMFNSRLPFALLGILTPLLIYCISYIFFKNQIIATLSSLVLVFSAWHLQLSRFAYEGGFSLFLYTLGVMFFLLVKRKRYFFLVLSMLAFTLGFYSYSGYKIIFLPIITVLTWYKFKELNYKHFLCILMFCLFTFVSFFYLSKTQDAASYGRNQFFFQNAEEASKAVELERRASLAPEFLKRLYHNKITYWSKIFVDRYQYALSPQYLFTSQEGNGIFSIWFRGQMYYLEAPLIFLGILFLFKRFRKELAIIIFSLLIAPLPAGLGPEPTTYTIRSSFMLPWLVILAGAGIYSLSIFIKQKKISIILYALVIFYYLYLIGGYLTQYYFEWTRYGAKYYSKSTQDLVLLIEREKSQRQSIIVGKAGSVTLLHYSFYNRVSPQITQNLYDKNPIIIENVVLQDKCPYLLKEEINILTDRNYLYILSPECFEENKKVGYKRNPSYTIKSPDGEDEWMVYKNELL